MTDRLTDAELDVMDGAFESYVSGSGELAYRAIAELRELRALDWKSLYADEMKENAELREQNAALTEAHSECETIIEHAVRHAASWKDDYTKEFYKNAALVAALAQIAEHWRDGSSCRWARGVATAALASVKGGQG